MNFRRSPLRRQITRYLLHILPFLLIIYWYRHQRVPSQSIYNRLNDILPVRYHGVWSNLHGGRQDEWYEIPMFPELKDVKWMGDWPVNDLGPPPVITSSVDKEGEELLPALVKLHIFSTCRSKGRRRRELIRAHSPLSTIPRDYQHLVELRFVIGYNDEFAGEEGQAEEKEIAEEIALHGDILRLGDLHRGENMDEGKSWEWVRQATSEGEREAWYIIKCDDDTLPILPNILDFLLLLDPRNPSYFGRTIWHEDLARYYMRGLMYGMSWGVAKSIAAADIHPRVRNRLHWEDSQMGMLMLSLPDKPEGPATPPEPLQPHVPLGHSSPSGATHPKDLRGSSTRSLLSAISIAEAHSDPRSGLRWIHLNQYVGEYAYPWVHNADDALAWHGLKQDQEYTDAWRKAKKTWERSRGAFMWDVPKELHYLSSNVTVS